MSSTTDTSSIPAFVIPIIEGYAAGIKPPIALLMVGTVFSSMLVPLLLSLFYFSTAEKRRTPTFLLVAFDVLLGLALGIWNGYIMLHSVLSPLDSSSSSKYISFVTLFLLSPWFIDLALVVRLLSVFPPLSTPRSKFAAIFTFPALIKLARLVMLILLACEWERGSRSLKQNNIGAGNSASWAHSPYFKAEWICQILDNAYVSAFFLWKLRDSAFGGSNGGAISSAPNSIGRRLKTLFWIAATNFVFPVLFDIAQMVVYYHYPYFTSAYVTYASIYVSIYGVVFATVWASSSARQHPSNVASLGSTTRRSNNIYSFKSGLQARAPNTPNTMTSPSEDSPRARLEKDGQWTDDFSSMRSPGSEIPLEIRIKKTQQREVV